MLYGTDILFVECDTCGTSYIDSKELNECKTKGCKGTLYYTDDTEGFLPPVED